MKRLSIPEKIKIKLEEPRLSKMLGVIHKISNKLDIDEAKLMRY